MLLHRDLRREVSTAVELRRLEAEAKAGDAVALLVGAGELEQGVLDAVSTGRDDWDGTAAALRDAACAAASVFLSGDDVATRHRAAAALAGAARCPLPQCVEIKGPEGYVHYGLDPAGYAAAARAYTRSVGVGVAARAVVVGVRSIGTSLSAVVAAVCGAPSVTVRARGEAGRRHVRAGAALARRVRGALERGGDALVVDEGPGLTGETFRCVAGWLETLGVPGNRIVLFPSGRAGMALAPAERRAWYDGMRRFPPPVEDARPARAAARLGLAELQDVGAGRWRQVVPGAAREPVFVALERLKYLGADAAGRRWVIRYGGVGRWFDEVLARAGRIAGAGLGPDAVPCGDGFFALPWADGRPMRRAIRPDRSFLDGLGAYLVGRAGRFGTGRTVAVDDAVKLLLENAAEAPGHDGEGLAAAARRLERLPAREAVLADARLQPREWVRTPAGWTKVDAVDHGDGIRWPGPTDAAWDLSAAAVEFELTTPSLERLIAACARAAGDAPAVLARAVEAYRPVYAACAYGEAALCARAAGDRVERGRLEREARFYAGILARELARARDRPHRLP